jgi:hypothetical protein
MALRGLEAGDQVDEAGGDGEFRAVGDVRLAEPHGHNAEAPDLGNGVLDAYAEAPHSLKVRQQIAHQEALD